MNRRRQPAKPSRERALRTPRPQDTPPTRRGTSQRLAASRAPTHEEVDFPSESSVTVPTRWVKALVGIFLLVPAWLLTQTFFGALAWAGLEHAFWATEAFLFFALGVGVWLLIYFILPRPWWVYVFGHELTHALAVWIAGGRVEGMRVSSRGGHILADRVNTWIALAPYFVPIYSVFILSSFGLASLFTDVTPHLRWLYGGLGFTWAFHFTFTCAMIPKGQSDLAYGGGFFSLVVIYLANLVLLSILLIVASDAVSPLLFLHELLQNGMDFFTGVAEILRWLRP